MLISCPECELQISDKALTCPHCGYPLKDISQNSPPRKIRPKKHPKLPNGFGQITELKNPNLRNKFRVMISQGKTEYGKPIQKLLKPKAYFPTYKAAYEALLKYHKDPFDLDASMTVRELHDAWVKSRRNGVTNYITAWKWCEPVYDMQVRDLRPKHIKKCIEGDIPVTIKPLIKILFNLMLDYAVEYELVERNIARSFEISSNINDDIEENKKEHMSFTDTEISKLWKAVGIVPEVDSMLVQCYMGWRPQELCLLRIEDVNLDKNYIVGGLKTEAGKGRIVPIHPCIKPIIEKKIAIAKSLGSEYLFNVKLVTKTGKESMIHMQYAKYRKCFNSILEELKLNPEHRPHDPRKHFVTMAKKNEMDEYAIKRIVGHRIDDITEAVYTDRDPEWLYQEVCKIPMPTKKYKAV